MLLLFSGGTHILNPNEANGNLLECRNRWTVCRGANPSRYSEKEGYQHRKGVGAGGGEGAFCKYSVLVP